MRHRSRCCHSLGLYGVHIPEHRQYGYVHGYDYGQCTVMERRRFFTHVRHVGCNDGGHDGSQRRAHALALRQRQSQKTPRIAAIRSHKYISVWLFSHLDWFRLAGNAGQLGPASSLSDDFYDGEQL